MTSKCSVTKWLVQSRDCWETVVIMYHFGVILAVFVLCESSVVGGLLQLQRQIKYGCNFSLVLILSNVLVYIGPYREHTLYVYMHACVYCINLMFCLKYQWPWCPAYWPRCPPISFKSQGQLALPSNCPNSRPVTGNEDVSIICWEWFQINIPSYERHGLE